MRAMPPKCRTSAAADDRARRAPHPLGPIFLRQRFTRRGPAWTVACVCALLLGTAAWMQPDPSGIGTHAQLGMPRCSWPLVWGIPCPTCGMTTSFALAVRGRWPAAVQAQPLGFIAALATMAVGILALLEGVSGRGWRVNWYRVPPRRILVVVILLLLAAWGYKILVFRASMG